MKTYSTNADSVIFSAMNTTANIIDTLQKNFGNGANISYQEIFHETQLQKTFATDENKLSATENFFRLCNRSPLDCNSDG